MDGFNKFFSPDDARSFTDGLQSGRDPLAFIFDGIESQQNAGNETPATKAKGFSKRLSKADEAFARALGVSLS